MQFQKFHLRSGFLVVKKNLVRFQFILKQNPLYQKQLSLLLLPDIVYSVFTLCFYHIDICQLCFSFRYVFNFIVCGAVNMLINKGLRTRILKADMYFQNSKFLSKILKFRKMQENRNCRFFSQAWYFLSVLKKALRPTEKLG